MELRISYNGIKHFTFYDILQSKWVTEWVSRVCLPSISEVTTGGTMARFFIGTNIALELIEVTADAKITAYAAELIVQRDVSLIS